MPFFGSPSNFRYLISSIDQSSSMTPGGTVVAVTGKEILKYGDLVFIDPLSGKASKSLETSLNIARKLGIVVGGSVTNYLATDDSTLIDVAMGAAGETYLVLTQGVGYATIDANGSVLIGSPITAGRTTAGRVRGDYVVSYARNPAGLAIKAGASALVKAVNVVQTVAAGVIGTATAANLDMAALSGTVANGAYNVFVFRVAGDGTTVTSAMGTAGATLAAVVWPAGSASLVTLGYVIIHPTGTGDFVGGTTALDDATVVPNAVYVNLIGDNKPVGYALEAGGNAATAVKVYLP